MSFGSQSDSNPFSQDPIAVSAHRRNYGCIIAFFVLLFLFLGVVPIGIYIFVSRRMGGRDVPEDVIPNQQTLRKESTQAFARAVPNYPPQDSAAIQALFRAIEQAARGKDHKGFLRLVDRQALFGIQQRLVTSRMVNPVDRTLYRWQLTNLIEAEESWHRIRVMGIEPLAGAGWLRVYVCCEDPQDQVMMYRFTITQHGTIWKVADWERLDLGLSKAEEWALYESYADDPSLENYTRMCDYMNRSSDLLAANDRDGAQQQLRLCESIAVPPELEDFVCVLVGYRWRMMGNEEEALRWFQRVKQPDEMPGAWLGQAYAQQSLGRDKLAFQFASKYEEAVGDDPDCSRLKAQLLAGRRKTEAAKEWRDVLRFRPSDMEALTAVANTLPSDRLAELEELIDGAAQPMRTAEELFATVQLSHPAAARALASVINRREPDSAGSLYVDGCMRNLDRDPAGAAQCFLQAAQKSTDNESRATYENAYLDAMITLGRLLEGYQSVSDAKRAFEYLVGLYDEENSFSDDQLLQLADAHRSRVPYDAMSDYYAGLAYTGKRKLADAERVLRAGLVRAKDDEQRELLYYQLSEVLYRQNRYMEGYRTVPPAKQRYRQLASRLVTSERWSELKELMDAHRAQHADDPLLVYHEANLLREQGQLRQARDKLIARLQNSPDVGDAAVMFRTEIADLSIELDDLEVAFRQIANEDDGFANIARQMMYRNEWPVLSKWIALGRQHSPNDPQIAEWEAEVLWGNKNYAGLVAHAADGRLANMAGLKSYQRARWHERIVRAWLRLGRFTEAEQLARQIQEDSDNLLPAILVSAMAGRAEETHRLIDEFRSEDQLVGDLYDDEDIGHLLWQPPHTEWRRRRPPDLPNLYAQSATVLLLRQPDMRTADELRSVLASVLSGDFSLTFVSTNDRRQGEAFTIRAGEMQLTIRREAASDSVAKNMENEIQDPSLREACRQHQAWLVIAGLRNSWLGNDDMTANAYRVARALVNENCLALRFVDLNRMALNDVDTVAALDAMAPEKRLEKLGAPVEYFEKSPSSYGTPAEIEAFYRQIRSFHEAHATRSPDQKFEIVAEVSASPFEDQITLGVDAIHSKYGSYNVVGSLVAESPIFPKFRAGEFFSVSEYRITEWRYTDDGKLITFRRPARRDEN